MDLSEIRDAARSKADEQTTDFIPDMELDRFINQGNRYLYNKIASRDAEHFLTKGSLANGGLFSTVVEQQSYSLPASFLKLAKVESRQLGSTTDDDWLRVQKGALGNNNRESFYPRLSMASTRLSDRAPWFSYFLGGSEIHLRPVPKEVYEVRLWFIPKPALLALPTDTPEVPEAYHDLISEYAAIQCLAKSGEAIFTERQRIFELDLDAMLAGIEHRDQMAEQMVITDREDYEGDYG